MNRVVLYQRYLSISAVRNRSFKYIKPDGQRKKDKQKLDEFQARLKLGMKGAMPKAYHHKMRHQRADQSRWHRMDPDEQRTHREEEESATGRIIKNIDEWKKKKRSNLYQPERIISIPGTDSQPLITCSGSGDAPDYSILQNQRYQNFDSISLYTSKFKGEPGKNVQTLTAARNRKQRRPEMKINAVEGNSSLSNISFADLGVNPRICDALFKLYGIRFASHIQVQIISQFLNSESDIIGISETGSGKTFAYLVPILHEFLESGATSLITTSSVILRRQIYRTLFDILLHMEDLDPPFEIVGSGSKLHTSPIGISTLGAKELISSANSTRKNLIFDEADLSFTDEHIDRSFNLLDSCSNAKAVCLQPFRFPTTRWGDIRERFAEAHIIETEESNRIPRHINQTFRYITPDEKEIEMIGILKKDPMPTIIFANRFSEIHHISRLLKMYKIENFRVIEKGVENMRENMVKLDQFDAGEFDILIGCDNIGRGVNLERPQRVINWSPPFSVADYLNRIGRCGRLNQSSIAEVHTYVTGSSNKVVRTGPQYQKLQHLEEAVRRHTKVYQIDSDFNFDQNLKIRTEMSLNPTLKWKDRNNRRYRKK